jgi:hypothetical protein
MGFNYYTHGNTDGNEYHKQFPNKPSVATEDASTFSTRGIYVEDPDHQHLTAYDVNKPDWGGPGGGIMVALRRAPYVAGLIQWTGFDYRGEETPFVWPAISSQFGILDVCGFPKDNFYYYQSWWSDHPVLHLLPHWNWAGKEGQDIDVWCYGNCDEVELFLNGQSQGRKPMKRNSHLAVESQIRARHPARARLQRRQGNPHRQRGNHRRPGLRATHPAPIHASSRRRRCGRHHRPGKRRARTHGSQRRERNRF